MSKEIESEKQKQESQEPKEIIPKILLKEFIALLWSDEQKKTKLKESNFKDIKAIVDFLLEQAEQDIKAGNTSGVFRIETQIIGKSIYVVYTYDALKSLVNSPHVNRAPTDYAGILLTSEKEGYDAVLEKVNPKLYVPMSNAIRDSLLEVTNRKNEDGSSIFGEEVTAVVDSVADQVTEAGKSMGSEHFTQIAAESIFSHIFPNGKWDGNEAETLFKKFSAVVKAVNTSTVFHPLIRLPKTLSAASTKLATYPFMSRLRRLANQEIKMREQGEKAPYKPGIISRLLDSDKEVSKADAIKTTSTFIAASIETASGALSEVFNQFAQYPDTFKTLQDALFNAESAEKSNNPILAKEARAQFNDMVENFIYEVVGIIAPAPMSLKATDGPVDMPDGYQIPAGEVVIALNIAVRALDKENFPQGPKASLVLSDLQKKLHRAMFWLAPDPSAVKAAKESGKELFNHQCKGFHYAIQFLKHAIINMLKNYERPIEDKNYKNDVEVSPTSKRTGHYILNRIQQAA